MANRAAVAREAELFELTAMQSVEPVQLRAAAQERYLNYSLSVITSRALPDVRDGLKPVQRRILFAMDQLGIRHDAKPRKCAFVCGNVVGNYHPHGESSVYDARPDGSTLGSAGAVGGRHRQFWFDRW